MSNTPSPPQAKVEPESGSEEVYCVCRKEDDGSFMIQCDTCSIWYAQHSYRQVSWTLWWIDSSTRTFN